MIFLNSVVIASLIPSVGLTSKNKPGEAHSSIRGPISAWNGLIQVLYQLFVGRGKYVVYRTAILYPLFLSALQYFVSIGSWQRPLVVLFVHVLGL